MSGTPSNRRHRSGHRGGPPPTRVGVIGAGAMGSHHARAYSSLGGLCELHGVYDVERARAATLATRFQTRAYSSLDALLADVDAVSIASPSSLHIEQALAALDAGVDVLVEKPVALTPDDGRRLRIAAAAAPERVVQVGHIEHFNPAIGELRKLLHDQQVIALEIQRLSPFDGRIADADVVQDLMLHDVHVVLSIARSPLCHVQTAGAKVQTDRLDYATSQLLFEDGLIASLSASRVTEEKIRRLSATTAEAHVRLDYLTRTIEVCRWTRLHQAVTDAGSYRQESIVERIFVPHEEPLVAELRSFLQCVRTGTQPEVDVTMGIQCLEVVDWIRGAVPSVASLQLAA